MKHVRLSIGAVCLMAAAAVASLQAAGAAAAATAVQNGKKSPVAKAQSTDRAKPANRSTTKSAAPASNAAVQPAAVQPALKPDGKVEAATLIEMFRGKTWLWPDGAAYFSPDGRFLAWAGKEPAESVAEGTWRVTPKGRLCFRATWVSRTGKAPSESCFVHGLKSGDVLQRREPSGEWYVFKHRESTPEDEFQKLVAGNQVGSDVKKVRTAIGGV
jgi:hypothetical protein